MNTTERSPLAIDAAAYRQDFPILSRQLREGVPLVYLDNAASTQRPQAVIDAMDACYEGYYANVHRGIHTLSEESTQKYEDARLRVAQFLSVANECELIFTAGTTAAINLVARSWGDANIKSGDVILTTMMEHHANIVPWQQLAQRTGCRVEFAPLTEDGRLCIESFDKRLSDLQPKLVALTAASNVLGTINPVAELVAKARDAGAVTLVDAAQAVPHAQVDVNQWDADFVTFSGHKVCGPTGIGVLHGKQQLLDAMPPFLGGGAMIHRVTTSGFEPAGLPEKFEAGTPAIAEAIGLAAAIDYVDSVGLDRIHAYELQLCTIAHEALQEIEGLHILGPDPKHKAGIVSFAIDGVHPHDISQWLDRRGIAVRAGHHCAMPLHELLQISASTRASFYFYNTPEEALQFAAAVRSARDKFNRPRKRT
ncbi:aminotransferase class V-fold PLP-dependent enzyme [Rosistilla oblonga]|uniref:cysteine desulfurase n=1 Tax=Rosistilla oblonga TaxID=2527990 RepID=A0A518IYM9_9BACT|nr:SufS family cysteine desulfurase [Rosistilla oblonga]QDV58178.1 putative cysteine desulfurase [Rosistilla oblonga]